MIGRCYGLSCGVLPDSFKKKQGILADLFADLVDFDLAGNEEKFPWMGVRRDYTNKSWNGIRPIRVPYDLENMNQDFNKRLIRKNPCFKGEEMKSRLNDGY
ncbi:hypothetical protein [Sphingobacterium cellulitidis]|uniref:hypothetical protein n=1 Tax=Sphingobacterium cellulitidis TaxID=1768011 RepID=UPI000B93D3E8|nr:hypothetical protein CHT99_16780 [Sphingobacterium cellulitidis]